MNPHHGLAAPLALAALAAWLLASAGTAHAADVQQNCTGLIIVTCSSAPPQPAPGVVAPTPVPFALPPIAGPSLAPIATPAATPPLSPVPTPVPSPTDAGIPIPIPSASPSATPIAVGADHNYSLPTLSPSSTGTGLDGGGILIRIFLVLGFLVIGSVASMFALR